MILFVALCTDMDLIPVLCGVHSVCKCDAIKPLLIDELNHGEFDLKQNKMSKQDM